MPQSDSRIPVILLTGFLGSGKTTVLNSWLTSPDLADTAVIVNEFGEVGIDHSLIASSNDNTIELSTGCLCCTVRGDLVETLRDLSEKRRSGKVRQFNRVLIETTGLADPVPVLQALMTFPVAQAYRMARAITVVEAVQGLGTLDRHPEAVRQVAIADALILSKTDLPAPDLQRLLQLLKKINPGAVQYHSNFRLPPPMALLSGDGMYDPAARPQDVQSWLGADRFDDHGVSDHHHHAHDVNRHDAAISSFCLSFDTPLVWEQVAHWLDSLAIAHGEDLLRVKGILDIAGRSRPVVVQAVQRLFHPPSELSSWPDAGRRSQIVFITRNLSRDFVAAVFDTIRSRQPVIAA